MGFLQRPAITRSSTPSPSRSPTNCGGPGSSEQLSPNSLCIYSSVTAGTGGLACAGGGGSGFFSAARVADVIASISETSTIRLQQILEYTMLSTLVPIFYEKYRYMR